MQASLETTTQTATSQNQALFTAWTAIESFNNHVSLYLLPQNTIFISLHHHLSQLQNYSYVKREANIKIWIISFFKFLKGSNNRKNQEPYRNSLVLPRAGEADKLRDFARPRLVLLHSSSSWHVEQWYAESELTSALPGHSLSRFISILEVKEPQWERNPIPVEKHQEKGDWEKKSLGISKANRVEF